MARMYPERLPTPPESVESAAERWLYTAFERALPDDVVVMHSVAWLLRERPSSDSRYWPPSEPTVADRHGEADFVIIHPRRGVLILEVKGGVIRRDGAADKWYRLSAAGIKYRITDPFEQGHRNIQNLRTILVDSRLTHNIFSHLGVKLYHAAAFPDCVFTNEHLGVNVSRALVLDYNDRENIPAA
ncbi:MAG: nuclease-related domain-containing protein, partial [Chloroflexia bacterium]